MGKMIRCTKIGVDCVANDPVDIRCGGPKYLGFDFNVQKDQTAEMIKFIDEALITFEIPMDSIYSTGDFNLSEEKVWTKERIVKAIREDADYLKSEADRHYSRRR